MTTGRPGQEIESLRSRLVDCRSLDEVARAWLCTRPPRRNIPGRPGQARVCCIRCKRCPAASPRPAQSSRRPLNKEGSSRTHAARRHQSGADSGLAASAKGLQRPLQARLRESKAFLTEDQEARYDEFLADLKAKRSHKRVANSWRKHRREWDNDSSIFVRSF